MDIDWMLEVCKTTNITQFSVDNYFTLFDNCLDKLIFDKTIIGRKKLEVIKELVLEIKRNFCNYPQYMEKLLSKVSFLSLQVDRNIVGSIGNLNSLDIKTFIKYCEKYELKKHGLFERIRMYLDCRILSKQTLNDILLEDINELTSYIKKKFSEMNLLKYKSELCERSRVLLQISNDKDKYNNEKYDYSVSNMINILNDKNYKNNKRKYVMISSALRKRAANKVQFTSKELDDLVILSFCIENTFYNNLEVEVNLFNKIKALSIMITKEYVDNSDLMDFTDFLELTKKLKKVSMKPLSKVIYSYLQKRIIGNKLLTKEELENISNYFDDIMMFNCDEEKYDVVNKSLIRLEYLKHLTVSNGDLEYKDEAEPRINTSFSSIVFNIIDELETDSIDYNKLGELFKKINEVFNTSMLSKKDIVLLYKLYEYMTKIESINSFDNLLEWKRLKRIFNECMVINEIVNSKNKEKIKQDFKDGNIVLNKEFSLPLLASISFSKGILDLSNKTIIAIDDADILDLDGAFSIDSDGENYILDVYITDVPTFLKNNKKLSVEAYKRGTSFYVRDSDGNKNIIGMLPEVLSFNYLSLLNQKPRDVLDFEFVFDDKGKLVSSNISRKTIKVNYKYTLRCK